jgi:threonine 3-dehydrogenase
MACTYFLTGGAGNLACQLTSHLQDADRVILYDLASQPVAAVSAQSQYIRGDLTRPGELLRLFQEHRPDIVLHLASLLSGACEQDRHAAMQVTVAGCFALFEAALETGVRQVFLPSSLAAYGSPLPDPLPEDYPQWPTGLYGVTKVACERLGVYYHQRHGLDFRCIRLPVVLSRFANPGAASSYGSQAFVEAVQSGRFTFKVRPSTRVSAVYVKDCLSAIIDLVQTQDARLSRRVYNIFALAPTAQDIADAIRARLLGADLRFEPDPQITGLVETWPAGITDESARHDWDWCPSYDLERLADDFLAELKATSY